MPDRSLMFCGTSLAARIDAAEARLTADIADAIGRRRPDRQVLMLPVSGGMAVYAGPGMPMTKVIAVGLTEPLTERDLDVVEAAWAQRAEPVRVELCTLSDGAAARLLTDRGYRLLGFENVLGRRLEQDDAGRSAIPGLTIEPVVDRGAYALWLRVSLDGFAQPDEGPLPTERFERRALEELFEDMADVPGFVRYLARVGGEPAGAAGMRLDSGLAQMSGAATLPVFRRRGIQTALTQRRLDDARAAGCDLAVVTTAPGSKSQENCHRRGFELLYARAILVKHPPAEAPTRR